MSSADHHPLAVVAIHHQSGLELIDHRCDRQSGPDALSLCQADGQILAHSVEREAEVALAEGHGHAAVGHLPPPGHVLRDSVDHLLDIEPGPAGEADLLGQALP